MAQNSDNCTHGSACPTNAFREAVCIDTRRIYDACCDKDCIKDLRVYFTLRGQSIVDTATIIKARSAEVVAVYFEVEPVAFNKGFFSVDITFFFKVKVAAYQNPAMSPTVVDGVAVFSKKVILFGSDASVKTFTTENATTACGKNAPVVNVQVIDPMILSLCVTECPHSDALQSFEPPTEICEMFDDVFCGFAPIKMITVSLGLFSIVQLERQVQIMVPVYGFCVPEKQCSEGSVVDDPCELFSKICFPKDDFFPPKLSDISD